MSAGEAGDCNPTLVSPSVPNYRVDELLSLLSGERVHEGACTRA